MTTQPPRKLSPQEETRLKQVRENFQRRRELSSKLDLIKNKIGVYSGKGGVGKSTVAVNLAVMLAEMGNKVAIFDCDIDCPNVAQLLRLSKGPQQVEDKFIPAEQYGVKAMSMGFFQQNEEEAIIWRGPMIHNAINQFTSMTEWGELDYLIVDLPPGTSDAPLTVMQTLKLDGFVVVTTPQDLATLDARRSANMIKKLNLRVLGIVENMSGDIFGMGSGEGLAEDLGVPFLGRLEMRSDYRTSKSPTVLESPFVRTEFTAITNSLLKTLTTNS